MLFLAALPAALQAQFTTITNNGQVYITGYTGSSTVVVIPGTIDGLPVVSIASQAFENLSGLTSVTIPNSVTTIEDNAFNGCTNLASVTIPDSVTTIGDSAFTNCSKLAAATIPDSVTTIGQYAFQYCPSLTSVTIPNNVTTIGRYAFGDNNFTSLTIGDSVTTIGDYAFNGCTKLTSVAIPNSVTSIGVGVFFDGFGLTSVTIGNGVTSIGQAAFDGCGKLTSIVIPGGVTSIGGSAFRSCNTLTSAVFLGDAPAMDLDVFKNTAAGFKVYYFAGRADFASPWTDSSGDTYPAVNLGTESDFATTTANNQVTITGYTGPGGAVIIPVTINGLTVTGIGAEAFQNNYDVTSVTIPAGVTSIGEAAFDNCANLAAINVSSQNPSYSSAGGVLFTPHTLVAYPEGKPGTGYTIPGTVTGIGDYAFDSCSQLTKVTIPGSVTSIGNYAFFQCSGLTGVSIPKSVTTLGSFVFGRSGLTHVIIPASVTVIGDDAFFLCQSLKSAVFAGGSPTLGNNVFGLNATGFKVSNLQLQTITFPAVGAVKAGQKVALKATSTSGLAITYSILAGPATVSGTTVTFTGAGTVKLAADQSGNAAYVSASQVRQNVTVGKGVQTIAAFTLVPDKTFGNAPFTIKVPKASSGLTVTVKVKSGPATISGTKLTLTGAGAVTLAADQAGNSSYDAAPEITTSFVVDKASQTITFPALTAAKVSQKVTLTSTSTSGLPITYSVIPTSGYTGTATISGSQLTFTGAGKIKLAADQAGNANYLGAAQVRQHVTITAQ